MNLELRNSNSRSTFIFPNFIRKRRSLLKKKKLCVLCQKQDKFMLTSLIRLYLKLARNVDIS